MKNAPSEQKNAVHWLLSVAGGKASYAVSDETVLIVTHRSAALSVCEKQVALSSGKIEQMETSR